MYQLKRIIWASLVILAGLGTAYVSFLLSHRFYDSPLETVVESTIYPVYEISFPAVTICNTNRINLQRVDEAVQKFLPNSSPEVVQLFKDFIGQMNDLEFGDFDIFNDFDAKSLRSLDHINLTEVFDFVVHTCEELFTKLCWWRKNYIPCCQIFIQQRSEYGICWAFNSAVNAVGMQKLIRESSFPWRTSSFGEWSALRTNVKLDPKARGPNNNSMPGIIISVHHPHEWPLIGKFISMGTSTEVDIEAKYSYAEKSTRSIPPEERECLFEDESRKDYYRRLPGLQYLRNNCIAECRQQYLLRYCNCTVEFFYPTGNYAVCKASDFVCLAKYNDIFNNEKPPESNSYFPIEELGMECSCLYECHILEYRTEISSINLKSNGTLNTIHLDIHFQQNTLIKYRTFVVFGWLDLLVSFGGIAGLFMGASLISAVEFAYSFTIGLGFYLQNRRRLHAMQNATAPETLSKSKKTKRNSNRFAITNGNDSLSRKNKF